MPTSNDLANPSVNRRTAIQELLLKSSIGLGIFAASQGIKVKHSYAVATSDIELVEIPGVLDQLDLGEAPSLAFPVRKKPNGEKVTDVLVMDYKRGHRLKYYDNLGSGSNIDLQENPGRVSGISLDNGTLIHPAVFDSKGDDISDLFVFGKQDGTYDSYLLDENGKHVQHPDFLKSTYEEGARKAPELRRLDGDDMLYIISGTRERGIICKRNENTIQDPNWVDAPERLDGIVENNGSLTNQNTISFVLKKDKGNIKRYAFIGRGLDKGVDVYNEMPGQSPLWVPINAVFPGDSFGQLTVARSVYNFRGDGKWAVVVTDLDSKKARYFELKDTSTVAVQDNSGMPKSYQLLQNYPNPANPTTTIEYQIPEAGRVKVTIYDLLGRKETLIDEYHQLGKHTLELDMSGRSSGVYFYQIQAENFRQTRKMMLLK